MGPSPATEKGRASSPSLGEGITSAKGKGKDPSENQAWEFTNMESVQLGAGGNTFPHPEASPLEWDSETQNAEEHSLHWTGFKQLGRKRKTYFRVSPEKKTLAGQDCHKNKGFQSVQTPGIEGWQSKPNSLSWTCVRLNGVGRWLLIFQWRRRDGEAILQQCTCLSPGFRHRVGILVVELLALSPWVDYVASGF